MNLQKVIFESPLKRAVRINKKGVKTIAYNYDDGIVITKTRIRKAFKEELLGYNDWNPVQLLYRR